ncbi:hypothetical protein ACA910_019964 [Epithemia clementina (nom. ined.)]
MQRERFISWDNTAYRQSVMLFGSSEITHSSPLTTSDSNITTTMHSSQWNPGVETPTRLTLDGTEDACQDDTLALEAYPLRRLSSSLTASSEAVHALFGESVGPCWGDFSCSHLRIRGRMYATSRAILFHTNLLGFERRICLLLRDIVHAELFRTTSIRIHTTDLETYIFKSFNNREQVLHLINGLKILVDKQQNGGQENGGPRKEAETSSVQNSNDVREPHLALTQSSATTTISGTYSSTNRSAFISTVGSPGIPILLPSPPATPNRRRASSDSLVRLPTRTENYSSSALNSTASSLVHWRLEPIESYEELSVHSEPGRLSPPDAADEPPEAVWARLKTSKSQLQDVGLESLTLSCSIDEYYQAFLAEGAQYALDYYQREYIKDKEVEMTGWDVCAEGDFRRTINFTHPIKNSMGIGPSCARTCRQQRLRKFPGLGMVLENRTYVEGIPGADCFYVQDMWLLEAANDKKRQVQLSVNFDVKFKKRSIFRSIIQKSVRKETKEWIAGYVDMVQGALRKDGDKEDASQKIQNQPTSSSLLADVSKLESVVSELVHKLDQAYRLILFLLAVFLVAQILTSYQIMSLKACVLDNNNENNFYSHRLDFPDLSLER